MKEDRQLRGSQLCTYLGPRKWINIALLIPHSGLGVDFVCVCGVSSMHRCCTDEDRDLGTGVIPT